MNEPSLICTMMVRLVTERESVMEEYNAVEGAIRFVAKIQSHNIKALTDWLTYAQDELIPFKVNVRETALGMVGGDMASQTYRNKASGAIKLIDKYKTVELAEMAISVHNAASKKASFCPNVLGAKLCPTDEDEVTPAARKKAAKVAARKHVKAVLSNKELTKKEMLAILNAGIAELS